MAVSMNAQATRLSSDEATDVADRFAAWCRRMRRKRREAHMQQLRAALGLGARAAAAGPPAAEPATTCASEEAAAPAAPAGPAAGLHPMHGLWHRALAQPTRLLQSRMSL